MIRQAETERYDGQGWVGSGGRDEAAGAGYEQIVDAMQFTVGIDNTGMRIVAHAGCAHVVPAAAGKFRPGIIARILQMFHELETGDAGAACFLADELVHGADTAFFQGSQFPMKDGAGHAKRIFFRAERDAGIRVGRLLDAGGKHIAVAAGIDGLRRLPSGGCAG